LRYNPHIMSLRADTSVSHDARCNIATALCATISLVIFSQLFTTVACAQRLSIRRYDVTDGLSDNSPEYLLQDSKGYLWVGHHTQICRFDGYRFACFDWRKQAGDYVIINSIAEDKRGRIWVGLEDGAHREAKWIARLIDAPRETDASKQPQDNFILFQVDPSKKANNIHKMVIDDADNIWCLTDAGLYRAVIGTDDKLDFQLVEAGETGYAAYADKSGCFWYERKDKPPPELVRICGNERIVFTVADGIIRHSLGAFVEDTDGRLFVASGKELFEFVTEKQVGANFSGGRVAQQDPPVGAGGTDLPGERGYWKSIPLPVLAQPSVTALAFDSSATLWIGTNSGLIRYRADGQKLYTTAQGLSHDNITNLLADREGNLWMGTSGGGLYKLAGEAFVSYTKAEGLPDDCLGWIAINQGGDVYAVGNRIAAIIDGKAIVLRDPVSVGPTEFPTKFKRDSQGNWWVGTDKGLYRFDGPKLQFKRGKKFTLADGIPEIQVHAIEEDKDGTIWVTQSDQFLRWLKPKSVPPAPTGGSYSSGQVQRLQSGIVFNMLADSHGNLWMGSHGWFAKWANGQFTYFEPSAGLPETRPRAFYQDSRGWLWVGLRTRGVSVTKDPRAAQPEFINYSKTDGLSGDWIDNIGEDDFGRIYIKSEIGGLDQFDPRNSNWRRITAKDGLAGDKVHYITKDAKGNIWIVTDKGLTKFNPRAERRAEAPPPIYFDRLTISGEDIPLKSGSSQIPEMTLQPAQNNMRIEFVGISFQSEHTLKYQYKLEGIDSDWSAPTDDRVVTFAQLSSGSYRFMVRAINRDGVASDKSAIVSFHIMPPVWRRWWFIALVLLATGSLIYVAYRYRIARMMELQQTRLRIARDLHDEVGSGLGSIGILSSLAADDEMDEIERKTLAQKIAATSGELGYTLGEIVWSLRDESETLESLAYHLTERASRLFPSDKPQLKTDFPAVWQDVKLSLPARRNLQLIVVEALHNAARHAQANHVVLSIAPVGRRWKITISDDGRGFFENAHSGMGLKNMRSRASEINAEIVWDSSPEKGTIVAITFDV